jgi:hypothetical protein
MITSISKTILASVAALTVGAAVLASVPASADVASARSGQSASPFAMGDVRLGGSSSAPLASSFTAFYSRGSAGASCAPFIVRHSRTDSIEYPIGCN